MGLTVEAVNFVVSFALVSTLFAAMFRFLPDARTAWPVCWAGGLVTAFLFTVGKTLIGLYLGRGAIASTYGAAGSLVLVLLWVYYSSLILLFGTALTRVTVMRRHGQVTPRKTAVRLRVEIEEQ
jgi:membrane protein